MIWAITDQFLGLISFSLKSTYDTILHSLLLETIVGVSLVKCHSDQVIPLLKPSFDKESMLYPYNGTFSSVQSLSCVRLFATPWITARQASLSITNSQSSFRLTSIESVMPSSHLILCRPLFLLPLIPPSIKVFSNESTLCLRWPKY